MTASDRRRRWIGVAALGLAVLILLVAEIFLRGKFGPLLILIAYTACLFFVFIAIVVALVDARFVARRGLEERRNLLTQALEDIEIKTKERESGHSDSTS